MKIETAETKNYSVPYEFGKEVGRGQVWDALRYVFENEIGTIDGRDIESWILDMSATAFVDRVDRYKRDQFRVGDVVRIKDSGVYFIVTSHELGIDILPGWVSGVNDKGHVECEDVTHVERTGWHIGAMVNALNELRDAVAMLKCNEATDDDE